MVNELTASLSPRYNPCRGVHVVLLSLVALLSALPAGLAADDDPAATSFGLRNGRQINAQLLVGGQPSAEQLDAMAAAGYQAVINLRGPDETGSWDQAPHLEALGLRYVHLPIASSEDLTIDLARRFAETLTSLQDQPVVVHCASGNRVGALFALKAFHVDGQSSDVALQLGRNHGLSSASLEEKVKLLLVDED